MKQKAATSMQYLYSIAAVTGAILYGYLLYRNMWISDDGYIYLSYVKNYIESGEAAFNPGEKVDAATGFLWFLLLSLFQKVFFFLDERQNAFVLSFVLSAASYGLVVREIYRGSRLWLLAIPFLFLTWVFVSFSTSGLETPLIVFLLIWLFVRMHSRGFWGRGNGFIVAVLPFVRPELGILMLLYVAVAALKRRYAVLGMIFAVLLILAFWRYMLFGDILPNTAFVKLFAETYDSGKWYFKEFFLSYPHYMFLFLVFVLLFTVRCLQKKLTLHDFYWVSSALLLGGYIYASGGDFMHGRFFIPVVVIVVLWTVTSLETMKSDIRGKGIHFVILFLFLLLALYASKQQPYCLKKDRNWYHGIMDEQSGYEKDNAHLHYWHDNNTWRWLTWTQHMDEMARSYKIESGAVYPAIGQVRYYSDPRYFYVFDKLSLTQAVGSFLDTGGHFTRIGHLAEIPDPLIYLEKQVTLYHTPDKELDTLLHFDYKGSQATLIALSQIDNYVKNGLLPKNTWEKVEDLIEYRFQENNVDAAFIFYLACRYPPHRKHYEKIRQMYEEKKKEKNWMSWYEKNREIIERAEGIQKGRKNALPERYLIYLKYRSFKPISPL